MTHRRRLVRLDVGRVFEQHHRDVLRYALSRTRDPQVALDITAETFAKVCEARNAFRGSPDEVMGWVWAIARNEVAAFHRTRQVELRAVRRLGLPPPQADDDEYARLAELVDAAPLRHDVEEALTRLPPDQREAIEQRVVAEWSYERMAQQAGVSVTAVRARVSRGLRALAVDPALTSAYRRGRG